jgi:hypothetical protein
MQHVSAAAAAFAASSAFFMMPELQQLTETRFQALHRRCQAGASLLPSSAFEGTADRQLKRFMLLLGSSANPIQ